MSKNIVTIQIHTTSLIILIEFYSSKENVKVMGHAYDKEREFYIIKVNVKAGHKYKLSIGFLSVLNNDLAGFYRSTYFDSEANETKVIGTSQMEATDARRAIPCFDEPALKAKFQINLGRLKSMNSIRNENFNFRSEK